uniref:Magnesium transporter n=1 Tax=Leersia perrieri TaxID=77586 RepID=A0A0D9VXJ3_9ORYZ
MASVSSPSSPSQAVLLLQTQLPLQTGGACLRYRRARRREPAALAPPLGLSSSSSAAAGRSLLLPLPALRAAVGKDGRAVTKEDEAASAAVEEEEVEVRREEDNKAGDDGAREAAARGSGRFSADYISLGIREPVYEVIEVRSNGRMSTKKISRRQLLKSSGLRLRDTRSVDPSLWLMNSMPSLLVREQAILVNLGSLRAIAMHERVLIFNYNSPGGKAFLDSLLPRLNPRNINGGPAMPFQLEVVEAALLSRIQRLEQRLMHIEPRVGALLEVLPNRLTADVLEQLRLSKQALVELGSRAGDLKQMLIDLLDDPHEIRRICIMGRNCTLDKLSDNMECSVPLEKQIAEEEEEEIEMLLENYLQRCESIHGQAERLLDSAREMEDSIAVNLSSRRLEVSRVELLLQVGTFCVAIGALIAGIFGMNLKSYLETNAWAFWATTGGIVVGAVAGFFIMYSYLKARKIL